MLIELHSHTYYSQGEKVFYDGTCSPEDMIRHAKSLGIGALGITDHDSIKGAEEGKKLEKKYGIIIIPGEEITTNDGHCLALGINERIKPGLEIEETIDAIHTQGGIAISPHPFDIKNDGLKEKARFCDAVEVFNALSIDRLSNRKAAKFASKYNMVRVAGSDAHHTSMIGNGMIETDASDLEEILKLIRKGRIKTRERYATVISIMNLAVLRLKISYPYVEKYIENNYSFPKKQVSRKLLSLVRKSPGNIDYLFKTMAYTSFAGVFTYSVARNVFRI